MLLNSKYKKKLKNDFNTLSDMVVDAALRSKERTQPSKLVDRKRDRLKRSNVTQLTACLCNLLILTSFWLEQQ